MVQNGTLQYGGGYYALLLLIEKCLKNLNKKTNLNIPTFIKWGITMILVSFGWGLFMADGYTFYELSNFIAKLLFSVHIESKVTIASLGLFGYLPYLFVGILLSFPTVEYVKMLGDKLSQIGSKSLYFLHDVALFAMLLLCIVFIVAGSYNPFIYYRF